MAQLDIRLRNLDHVIRRLETYPARISDEIKRELKAASDDVATKAKRDAPKNIGRLVQSIVVVESGSLSNSVEINADYAASMEWGTKKKVRVPSQLQAYAAQFKGMNIGAGQLTLDAAILAWVKRKGIGGKTTKSGKVSRSKSSISAMESAAFLIARSIRKNGVTPHPFFFKHVFAIRKRLELKILKIAQDGAV